MPPVNYMAYKRHVKWGSLWGEAKASRVWRFTAHALRKADLSQTITGRRRNEVVDINVVPNKHSLQLLSNAVKLVAQQDPCLKQAHVYDLHESIDQDACSPERGFESLALLETI